MKNKKVLKTNRDIRREMCSQAVPEVRKLVKRFDLASVQSAVKALYNEKAAEKELDAAEKKVAALKKTLGK